MRLLIPGVAIAAIGGVIAADLARVVGIVILMIGAVLILAARFVSSSRRT